ncbi:hypothetical protein [Vulcanisaeta distributa]|uniref:hypothetical protein n=1 Tax=Vulcanisaeta distributa TaxID=164451 RepID=UPI001FB1A390|nr:hypothetical protein [Vulcanisaeta distributa]
MNNGLRVLEQALRNLGATDDEVRKAINLGRKALISSYPNPMDINELSRQLLARVRTPQKQHRS